jgi:adenylosuccinate synthase
VFWIEFILITASQEEFEGIEVDFITLPGWQAPTCQCRQFVELPPNAQAYIRKIEELLGVPGKDFFLLCAFD